MPRSSNQSCRRQELPSPCTKLRQSRSSTCPLGQARTKRVGTTCSRSNSPLSSSALRCTRRRERSRCPPPGCPPSFSWTTNHSGNRQAPMPLRVAHGSLGGGRRRVEPGRRHAGQVPELVCEPRLDHFIQSLRPRIEAADDRRVSRQVDERAGAVRRDDLTLAKLSVGATAHGSTSRPVGSRMYRSTSGSTSRSDRFARNLRCSSDSNSVSSISRNSGRPCFISYC